MDATSTSFGSPLFPQSTRRMSIGVMMPMAERSAFGGSPRFEDIRQMAETVEEAGLDGISFPDHFVSRPDDPGGVRGFWEVGSIIAAIAASTRVVSLSVLVACAIYRNPFLTAKMAETLDEISNGRFILGLGAGWSKPDFDMAGLPFDHRVSRFEEALSIIHPLLRHGRIDFQGHYYSANGAVSTPRGPRSSSGGIPILMGTKGPRMMRLTAQFADAWNAVYYSDAKELIPLLKVLDEACEQVGRPPESLVRTAGGHIAMEGYLGFRPDPTRGGPAELAEKIEEFRTLGIAHFIASLDPCTPRSIEEFGHVVELLDKHQGV
jgi:alkanesulfonate monooxygenase SsuD/methylene tetrahydromethanopterin reductase-like flavin-dependent oxidoreductase (luciferase family)